MSFPLTIPVSMPHHYVNSHFYGTSQPHVPAVVTTAFGSVAIMSGNNGSVEASQPAPPPSGPPSQQHKPRTVPIRKQSVFVAPSGISAIRAANSGRTTGPYALLAHSPSPPPSVTPPHHNYLPHYTNHHQHHHHHHHHRSVPARTEWNAGQNPLDLSDNLSHHSVIRSGARQSIQRSPSREDISQHISKIIQNNKAIIESYEPYSYHNSPRHSSKRSMSTAQLHSMESFVQSVITSGVTAGAVVPVSPVPAYHTYHSSDRLSPPNRRFSSEVATNVNNYSKLQSALLGESKMLNEVPIADRGFYLNRKYSCNNSTDPNGHHHVATHLQPVPEQVRYSLQHEQLLSSFYYHQQQQQHSRETRKPSVIINPRDLQAAGMDGSLALLPLCESSRSSSEPSLVRNLLTSKTSAFTLVSNELASSYGQTLGSTSSNVQSDSSIIKDLLLKSRHVSQSASGNETLEVMSQPPPRKRSHTESLSEHSAGSLGAESSSQSHSPTSHLMFTCPQCHVAFRNQQNLEIHQRYYCRGDTLRQSMTSDTNEAPVPKYRKSLSGAPERSRKLSIPQRKVSVLDRPSIITYTTNENSSSTMSDTSEESSRNELNQSEDNFGNILKSKLLSHDSEISDSIITLKKRKISEPAFRYHYDSRSSRDSSHKSMQRASVLQMASRVEKSQENSLEVLRDYSPYLMRPSTKITIKPPVEFLVLQDLVDTCMNHEFAVEEDVSEKTSSFLPTTMESSLESNAQLVVKPSEPSESEFHIASEVRETLSNLLDEVERRAWRDVMTGQFGSKASPSSELSSEVTHCLSDLIDTVANKMTTVDSGPWATKKSTPTRPTTLNFASTCSYEQSTRNQFELLKKTSKLSIFVNRLSNQEESGKLNQLVASTLVSPDTPRPKRKYQQLYLNGNAYTNLGLKEAYPQLSMYSQWKTHPISPGDLLEHVRLLLASYNSQEAVYVASQSRLSLIEVATAATMGGIDRAQVDEGDDVPVSRTSSIVARDFLDRVGREHTGKSTPDSSLSCTTRNPDRTLKAATVPIGEGYTSRLIDSGTRSQLILTHSSYHRVGTQRLQLQRTRKRSRTHPPDFCKAKKLSTGENPIEEMAIAGSSTSPPITTTSQQTVQNLSPGTSKPSTEATCTVRQRKRSSTVIPPSLSNNFGPFMSMHPILGHLPNKSKQTVMYIMMMSQAPPALALPSVSQMTSSKGLTSRKFSECIGLRQSGIDEQWATKIGPDGTTEIVPKRIKIFEGGFKSNEDYTYIRGRGRGKYVCEDCGIRCKKPSMLKKHIRTHTDLRPYSCRHCAFAFKTKGNLTKHMKSKAHHKKCVELGIYPVPTTIDDSQIDNEALAKQEQYELSCGSSGVFNQFDDDDEDGDDYDDDNFDEEDDDDEGVPIPVIEQQRLTYIEPGQFDDADNDKNSDGLLTSKKLSTSKAQRKISESSVEHHASCGTNNSSLTSTSISDRVEVSSGARLLCLDDNILNPVLSITSGAKRQAEDRDKNRLISSLATTQTALSLPAAAAMIISPSQINNGDEGGGDGGSGSSGNPSTEALSAVKKSSIDQSYHQDQSTIRAGLSLASLESTRNGSSAHSTIASQINQNITQENEAEAARSLLILSGLATNAADLTQSAGTVKSSDSAQHVSPSSLPRKSSVPPKKNSALLMDSANSMLSSHHRSSSGSERTNVIPAMSNPTNQVLLANEQSTLEMLRRSHPTSVIISHSQSASSESRKMSKHSERVHSPNSLIEPGRSYVYAHETAGLKGGSVLSHAKITSEHNITTPSQTRVANTPTLAYNNFSPQLLQHYSRLDPITLARTQQQLMEEFQKRVIPNSNDQLNASVFQSLMAAVNQKGLPYGTQILPTATSSSLNVPDLFVYQRAQSVQASNTSAIPTLPDSATLAQQQKILQQFYENFPQSSSLNAPKPQLLSNKSSNPNQYLAHNSELNRLNDPQKSNLNLLSNHVHLATSMYNPNQTVGPRTVVSKELPSKPNVAKRNESHIYDNELCKTSHNSNLSVESNLQSSGRVNSSPVPTQYRTNSPSATAQQRKSPTSALLRSSPLTLSTSTSTVPHSQSTDLDQPIDLSKSSVITKESEPAVLAQTPRQSSPVKPVTPEASSSQATVLSPQHPSPLKKHFSPLFEKHHLTDQITRSFSTLNELQTLPVQKTFDQSHPNGHELYKRLRSEEFVHLAPGVHTPHRLPKNIQHLLNNHSNASSSSSDAPKSESSMVKVTSVSPSPSISSSGSSSSPSSVPFTTGEGKSTCPTCMKQFSKPAQLRLHYNIHLFERPFRCDACAVSFRTKGHLQKHSRSVSHLNKLNMSLTFGRPSNDNPRPFKCSDCKIAFRIHGHLAKHLRSKMHIMKLECLGKLPFGMFAEMERSNIELTTIDTTDCEKALESLRSLAQKLYDPRQMCWKMVETPDDVMDDDVIEEDGDDMDCELDDELVIDEEHSESSEPQPSTSQMINGETTSLSQVPSTPVKVITPPITPLPVSTPSNPQQNSPPTVNNTSGIASTRSNTCHLCGRLFKAAKFLQVHLYTEHPEATQSASDSTLSSH